MSKKKKKIHQHSQDNTFKPNIGNKNTIIVTNPSTPVLQPLINDKQNLLFRKLFFATAAFFSILIPVLSFDIGINGDDRYQVPYSEQVLNFYLSFGKDRSCIEKTPGPTTYMYGGLLEFTSAAVNKILGHNEIIKNNYHTTRHFIISLFGVLTIIFTGLLAKELIDWRTGWLALLLTFLSPRFLGESVFNPKDIPFAMAYSMTLYFMICFFKQLPKPNKKIITGLILGIAAAINVRAGGLLLIVYLFFFSAIGFIFYKYFNKKKKFNKDIIYSSAYRIIFVAISGYLGGMILWPYGLIDPINNPLTALAGVSNFHTNLEMLFEGKHIWANNIPWHYIPKWIFITIPLFSVVGFVSIIFFLNKMLKQLDNGKYLLLTLFACIFPVFYVIYQKSTLYDGWRHMIFVYPPMVALTSVSWNYFLNYFNNKIAKYAVLGIFVLFMAQPMYWIIKNHPNEYVYFNQFVGGVENAFGYYETDYWMNCVKEASEWLIKNENLDKTDKKITIYTDSWYPAYVYFNSIPNSKNIEVGYTSFNNRHTKEWDYGIFFSRFVNCKMLQDKTWPPNGVIYEVKADDIILCVVVKNEHKYGFKGYDALVKRNNQQALEYLQKAVEYDPNDETSLLNLGIAHIYNNNYDEAIKYMKRSFDIYPTNAAAVNNLGYACIRKNDFDQAIYYYSKAVEINPNYDEPYFNLGIAYAQKNNLNAAITSFKQVIAINPNHEQSLTNLALIYQQKGDAKTAQQYFDKANKIKNKSN